MRLEATASASGSSCKSLKRFAFSLREMGAVED